MEKVEKENKELLLKDLCARLSYGVICHTPKGDGHLCSIIQTIFGIEYGVNIKAIERDYFNDYFNDKEVCIKPYLRPMSSMTYEEKVEYLNICGNEMENPLSSPRYNGIDYLNSIHVDYRGLIPKGLAIEVIESNNPYKD